MGPIYFKLHTLTFLLIKQIDRVEKLVPPPPLVGGGPPRGKVDQWLLYSTTLLYRT